MRSQKSSTVSQQLHASKQVFIELSPLLVRASEPVLDNSISLLSSPRVSYTKRCKLQQGLQRMQNVVKLRVHTTTFANPVKQFPKQRHQTLDLRFEP